MFENITSGSVKSAMKGVSSADLWAVPIDNIHILPGFNVRTDNDDYEAYVEGLTNSIMVNGYQRDKPLTGYVAKVDGKDIVYVVDGHSRLRACRAAIARGAEIATIPVITKPAGTQIEDLVVGLAISSTGRPLTPIERAAVCKRLVDYGMEIKVIASRLSISVGYVNDLLMLIGAPKKIRAMVESDGVSASNACAAIKTHGDKAAEVLGSKLDTAKASGKTRITQATIKPKVNKVLEDGLVYIRKFGRENPDEFSFEQFTLFAGLLANVAGVEERLVRDRFEAIPLPL